MFRKELEKLINKYSMENGSNTPDFILAAYLTDSLALFDRTVHSRERWFGREDNPIAGNEVTTPTIKESSDKE
jgi:hypothetical protein